jgi:hypothetical protein
MPGESTALGEGVPANGLPVFTDLQEPPNHPDGNCSSDTDICDTEGNSLMATAAPCVACRPTCLWISVCGSLSVVQMCMLQACCCVTCLSCVVHVLCFAGVTSLVGRSVDLMCLSGCTPVLAAPTLSPHRYKASKPWACSLLYWWFDETTIPPPSPVEHQGRAAATIQPPHTTTMVIPVPPPLQHWCRIKPLPPSSQLHAPFVLVFLHITSQTDKYERIQTCTCLPNVSFIYTHLCAH